MNKLNEIMVALLKIGLSKKEVDFYLLIIRSGEITASKISKITGESRTHIYDTLNKLLEKGLIAYVVKNNVKYFKSANPERLLDYLKEKEAEIEERKREVLQIIPRIKKMQAIEGKESTKIEIFEGKEGLKAVLNDIIREGKDFVTWGATDKIKEYLPDLFIKKYLKERERKNIRAKQLFTEYYGVLKTPLSENRKLPKEFASPTTTLVYGNKVAVWLWMSVPQVILIESKDLADSYRHYFDLMWSASESFVK